MGLRRGTATQVLLTRNLLPVRFDRLVGTGKMQCPWVCQRAGSEPCNGDGKSLVQEKSCDFLQVLEISVRAEHGNYLIARARDLKHL